MRWGSPVLIVLSDYFTVIYLSLLLILYFLSYSKFAWFCIFVLFCLGCSVCLLSETSGGTRGDDIHLFFVCIFNHFDIYVNYIQCFMCSCELVCFDFGFVFYWLGPFQLYFLLEMRFTCFFVFFSCWLGHFMSEVYIFPNSFFLSLVCFVVHL